MYVVGGLYGNLPALDAVEALARRERQPSTLCFNGDFNWFNIHDERFAEVNRRVLFHDATLGNVEAELTAVGSGNDAGCGCAYPDSVDDLTVERSNAIHLKLKETSRRHPFVRAALARLDMFARYRIGDCRVGVVHGDCDSLAGWGFDATELDSPTNLSWIRSGFEKAQVDVFASTHTCLPAMRELSVTDERRGCVINNGAAGMPNFSADLRGLVTRISTSPATEAELGEICVRGAYVSLQPVRYDNVRWQAQFLEQWPEGSDAWQSYFARIMCGPKYTRSQAVPTMLLSQQ